MLDSQDSREDLPSLAADSNSSVDNQSEMMILKKGSHSALEPIICDFCKENTTTHACRFKCPFGRQQIEGETETICGLAFCLCCREKYGTNEGGQNSSLCFKHNPNCSQQIYVEECSIPTVDEIEGDTMTDKSEESFQNSMEETTKYMPDYIEVQSVIDALKCIKSTSDDVYEESDQRASPGHKLIHYRFEATKYVEGGGYLKMGKKIK